MPSGKALGLFMRRTQSARRSLARIFLGCWLLLYPDFLSQSVAEEARIDDSFTWKRDVATGKELAASRSDTSFNFFDVGDLSYYSQYLVEQDLRRISIAAGLMIEHVPAKNSTIAIVHEKKVFERLKNEKPAFKLLGFPDHLIASLEKKVTSDSSKCLTMTIADGENNIVMTVILLSEKFDSCLMTGLLGSFGIAASDISAKTLIDVCVLYEGRRQGLRDRESLTQEAPRLRKLCIAKAEASNDKPAPAAPVNAAEGQ